MGTFKIAQQNYCEFYTNGVWDEEKGKKMLGCYYIEERLDYIHRFYECLLTSDKMNDLGILYLTHSNLSVRKTVELYNRHLPVHKQINENTGKSRIIACANKVNNSFTNLSNTDLQINKIINEEPLKILMASGVIGESRLKTLREAEEQIDKFIDMFKSSKKDKKEQIAIKIPAYMKVNTLSEEQFDNFMDIIRPYSRREMRCVEQYIKEMKEEVGYFNFLLTPGMKLTNEDIERRDIILRWLDIGNDDNAI